MKSGVWISQKYIQNNCEEMILLERIHRNILLVYRFVARVRGF
jgi:hypothetical protein